MSERIGILGGTFDPIHLGHLAFAEAARAACGLDRVLVMPACLPVYKMDQAVTPAEQRLEMCRLACEDNPAFEVSPLEIDRGGKTYTADTLRALAAGAGAGATAGAGAGALGAAGAGALGAAGAGATTGATGAELFFLVSADAAITVPKWRESDVIARLATIVTSDRPGVVWPRNISRETLDGRFRVEFVDAPQLDIASSDLRARVHAGQSIRYLVPDKVYEYIEINGLYR